MFTPTFYPPCLFTHTVPSHTQSSHIHSPFTRPIRSQAAQIRSTSIRLLDVRALGSKPSGIRAQWDPGPVGSGPSGIRAQWDPSPAIPGPSGIPARRYLAQWDPSPAIPGPVGSQPGDTWPSRSGGRCRAVCRVACLHAYLRGIPVAAHTVLGISVGSPPWQTVTGSSFHSTAQAKCTVRLTRSESPRHATDPLAYHLWKPAQSAIVSRNPACGRFRLFDYYPRTLHRLVDARYRTDHR